MTELTKPADTAVGGALGALRRNITNTRQALPTSSTQPILRMGKDGLWVYGVDNVDLTEDALFAANPLDIKHGFVCWTNYPASAKKKNKLKGEVYVGMAAAPIDPSTLQEHLDDDGNVCEWKPAAVVQMVCVQGEDTGVQVVYKPSSLGGTNFVDKLLAAIGAQLDEGSDKVVPHLELISDSYNHTTYGKVYTPDFVIKGWSSLDETDPAEATPAKEKPKRQRAATKKTEAPKDDARVEEAETIEEAAEAPQDETPKAEGRTRRRRRAS